MSFVSLNPTMLSLKPDPELLPLQKSHLKLRSSALNLKTNPGRLLYPHQSQSLCPLTHSAMARYDMNSTTFSDFSYKSPAFQQSVAFLALVDSFKQSFFDHNAFFHLRLFFVEFISFIYPFFC